MHTSESLDPVVSRLLENLPIVNCWLADMDDALHLLSTLTDLLNHPHPAGLDGDRLLALLRVALKDLSGGVNELQCILNISEKSKTRDMTPVTPSDMTPMTPLTPVTPDTSDMTPLTLDQFVAALFPVNGVNGNGKN